MPSSTVESSTRSDPRREVLSQPRVTPLIGDWESQRRSFTWAAGRDLLDGPDDGHLNIAHEAVDRHATGPLADTVALRFLHRQQATTELTYAELSHETDVVAAALHQLGLGRGDVVASLLPRLPELYLTVLGTLKAGVVFCPLFPAFGPEPVRERLALGRARLLVTDRASYERKVAPFRDALPRPWWSWTPRTPTSWQGRRAGRSSPRRGARGSASTAPIVP